jgi:hypothetical protein
VIVCERNNKKFTLEKFGLKPVTEGDEASESKVFLPGKPLVTEALMRVNPFQKFVLINVILKSVFIILSKVYPAPAIVVAERVKLSPESRLNELLLVLIKG